MTIQYQFALRIIFSGWLLLYPIGYIWYLITKYIYALIRSTQSKLDEIKTLDKVKQEFIKQHKEELAKQDEIWTPELQNIQESTPKESTQQLQQHIIQWFNESAWSNTAAQETGTQEQSIESEAIITPDPVQQHKKNKFIEKIIYEAQISKERWQLDMYEKKLIEWLAIQQNHLDLNKMLADLYFHTWQYKKSLTLLKKVIERKPDDHKVLRQIGEIYLQRWQFDTAQMLIEKALHYKPTNPRYYVSMVEIKYNTNQLDEAISLMEKVIKLRPSNVDYLNAIAKLYEESKDTINAKKYYYKVLEIEPTNEKAKMKMRRL